MRNTHPSEIFHIRSVTFVHKNVHLALRIHSENVMRGIVPRLNHRRRRASRRIEGEIIVGKGDGVVVVLSRDHLRRIETSRRVPASPGQGRRQHRRHLSHVRAGVHPPSKPGWPGGCRQSTSASMNINTNRRYVYTAFPLSVMFMPQTPVVEDCNFYPRHRMTAEAGKSKYVTFPG